MARVRIRRRDIEAERLPHVCMVCGDDATTTVQKTFAVTPAWAGVVGLLVLCVGNLLGIIIYMIVLESVKQRISIGVPVCERHRGYFSKRAIFRAILTALCFIVPAVVVVAAIIFADEREAPMVAILSGILSFAVTLIVVAVIVSTIHNGSIRAEEIDDRSVTLVKVAEGFDHAASERREYDDDSDEGIRPRRIIRSSEDVSPERRESFRERPDEEDRPRRRRQADED
jgi:hypothetical protein